MERFWAIGLIAVAIAGVVRYMPFVPHRWRVIASVAILLGFLCWLPFTVNTFRTSQLTTAAAWGMVAVGLNLLTGYNGQISLGHGAFVLIGAYTAGVLTDSTTQINFIDATPWPFWLAVIMGGVIAAGAGFVIAVPSLRLSGPYLAIATLALMLALPSVFERYDTFSGGRQGIHAPQPPAPPGLYVLTNAQWLFFLVLFAAAAMTAIAWWIVHSRWGRAFVAVRDSEVAAAAVGISVARYKVLAFTISAFYAGIAGALYFFAVNGFVNPLSIDVTLSINYFTGIVIGGLGSIFGSLIGGFIVVFLPDIATKLGAIFVGDDNAKRLWPAFYGGILIVVIILMPYGIAGFLQRLDRLRAGQAGSSIRGIPAALSARINGMATGVSRALEGARGKDGGAGKP